jgi:methionyl-tRNA formyltransferase
VTRLTIFAMTRKGLAVVRRALLANRAAVAMVVGARDSSLDDDGYDAIAAECAAHGVRHVDRGQVAAVDTPWALAVSWRWLLNLERTRLIVLHDSLLPRLRGFNPLVTALVNGDRQIGVSALIACEEMDRGDIVAQTATAIDYPITVSRAIDMLMPLYESLAEQVVRKIGANQDLQGVAQDETEATYSLWRDDDDYFVPWQRDAACLQRFIDAVGPPYRGAASWLDGRIVRILSARLLPERRIENRAPGKVMMLQNGAPVVVCGQGLLLLTDVRDDRSGQSVLPLRRSRVRFRTAPGPQPIAD